MPGAPAVTCCAIANALKRPSPVMTGRWDWRRTMPGPGPIAPPACRCCAGSMRRGLSVEKALALAPDHSHGLAVRGSLLCEMGHLAEGLDSYRRRAALLFGGQKLAAAKDDPDHKRRHDAGQQGYLAAQGVTPDRFHIAGGERLDGPAVNPANAQAIAAAMGRQRSQAGGDRQSADAGGAGRAAALLLGLDHLAEALRGRLSGRVSGTWFCLSAAGPDRRRIARHFSRDLRPPSVCAICGRSNMTSSLRGISIHADEAAVNVNFWITPDEANLRSRQWRAGGVGQGRRRWTGISRRSNGDEAAARDFFREAAQSR